MARNVGPYELLQKIAVGGAAEIYRARKTGARGFEQFYAVKLLLSHLEDDPDHRKMMVDEARLTAQLDHPNIVKVHDLGEDGDLLFLVMEHVKGVNLAELLELAKNKQVIIPIEAAVYIAREVCSALYYAHTRVAPDGSSLDLVHRDISPQNILVGYGGEVKVIDFGVAKASIGGRIETKTGIIKGKLTYMAPEYAMGSQQDHRCDIFATGLCLYEMLIGRAAYDIEDPYEMVDAVKNARMPQPSTQRADVDPELEHILAKAVEQKPQNRWNTAAEFQTALTGYLSRRDAQYRKETLAQWIGGLIPQPSASPAPKPHTAHGAPAVAEQSPDLSDVLATQSSPADSLRRSDRAPRKTTMGMPAAGLERLDPPKPADASRTSFGMPVGGPDTEPIAPLSLANLADIQNDDDGKLGPTMETLALQPDDEIEHTGRLEPDAATGRLTADDVDDHLETGRISGDEGDEYDDYGDDVSTSRLAMDQGPPLVEIDGSLLEEVGETGPRAQVPSAPQGRSEMPTATDIDVNAIRGDMVQKVANPDLPQILTQSGFQEFAERPDYWQQNEVDPMAMTAAHEALQDPSGIHAQPHPTAPTSMPGYGQVLQPAAPDVAQNYVSENATTAKRDQPLQMQEPPAQAPPQPYSTGVPQDPAPGSERYVPGQRPPEHTPDSGFVNRLLFGALVLVGLVVVAWIMIF